MDELLEVKKNEVEAWELSKSIKMLNPRTLDLQNRLPPPTAATLLVQENKSKRKMQYVYAKLNILWLAVRSWILFQTRMAALKRKGRCFFCLSSRHHVS